MWQAGTTRDRIRSKLSHVLLDIGSQHSWLEMAVGVDSSGVVFVDVSVLFSMEVNTASSTPMKCCLQLSSGSPPAAEPELVLFSSGVSCPVECPAQSDGLASSLIVIGTGLAAADSACPGAMESLGRSFHMTCS